MKRGQLRSPADREDRRLTIRTAPLPWFRASTLRTFLPSTSFSLIHTLATPTSLTPPFSKRVTLALTSCRISSPSSPSPLPVKADSPPAPASPSVASPAVASPPDSVAAGVVAAVEGAELVPNEKAGTAGADEAEADPNEKPVEAAGVEVEGALLTPKEKPGLVLNALLLSFLAPRAAPNPNEGGEAPPKAVAIGGDEAGLLLEAEPNLMGVELPAPKEKGVEVAGVEDEPKGLAVDVGAAVEGANEKGAASLFFGSSFFSSAFLASAPLAIAPKLAPNENGTGAFFSPSSTVFSSFFSAGGGDTLSPKRRGLGAAGALTSLVTLAVLGLEAGAGVGAGEGADARVDEVEAGDEAAAGKEKALFSA